MYNIPKIFSSLLKSVKRRQFQNVLNGRYDGGNFFQILNEKKKQLFKNEISSLPLSTLSHHSPSLSSLFLSSPFSPTLFPLLLYISPSTSLPPVLPLFLFLSHSLSPSLLLFLFHYPILNTSLSISSWLYIRRENQICLFIQNPFYILFTQRLKNFKSS